MTIPNETRLIKTGRNVQRVINGNIETARSYLEKCETMVPEICFWADNFIKDNGGEQAVADNLLKTVSEIVMSEKEVTDSQVAGLLILAVKIRLAGFQPVIPDFWHKTNQSVN